MGGAMRILIVSLAALAAVSFGACSGLVRNPEFAECMNACAKEQNICVLNATSAKQIEECNARQEQCVKTCQAEHKRYIKPE